MSARTEREKRVYEKEIEKLEHRCVVLLVCAQHGHVVNGVQVPCGNTRHENEETTI